MLANPDVRTLVMEEIRTLLLEDADGVEALTGHEELHELGLNSLLLARLVIQLEAVVGVDPFAREDVAISDVRSVDDLVAAYESVAAGAVEAS